MCPEGIISSTGKEVLCPRETSSLSLSSATLTDINSAHTPLNRDDGGLLPDAYLHLVRKKAAN